MSPVRKKQKSSRSPPSTEPAPLVIREAVNVEALRQLCRYSGVSDVGQLPKELQKDVEDIMENALRAPEGLDVDQSMCHCYAQRSRHAPEDTPKLRHYIENRLMNIGGEPLIRRVLHKANKTLQDMPKFVLEFQAEQSVLLGKDVANHPELARQLPPGTLQSVLNEEYERKNTDLLAELSSAFGLVNSYEHDGIYCLAMPSQHSELLARANAIVPVKGTGPWSVETAVEALRQRFPSLSWDEVDERWELQQEKCMEIRRRCLHGQKNFPKLLADVVPYHRLASGYMVKEVFKAVPVREDKMCLMFFVDGCWATYQWWCIRCILLQRMNGGLFDMSWHLSLDGDDTRHIFAYNDGTFQDTRDYTLKPMRPGIPVTWNADRPYPGALIAELEAKMTLNLVEILTRGFRYSPELERDLDRVASILPFYEIMASCHEDPPTTFHVLKGMARVKAAPENFEEARFHQGEGQNGKGLMNALFRTFCGEYHVEPKADVFSAFSDPSGTSIPLLQLRGRRSMSVNEVEAGVKMRSGMLKDLRDQSSFVEARGLYKDPVRFRPQFMMNFSSNASFEFRAIDGGMRRSFTAIPWPFKFVARPAPNSNERQLRNNLKQRDFLLANVIPSMEIILKEVDLMFLRDSVSTLVEPRTQSVLACTAHLFESLQLQDIREVLDSIPLSPNAALASSQGDVRKFFRDHDAVKGLKLSGKQLDRLLQEVLVPKTVRGKRVYSAKGNEETFLNVANEPPF
ncbi:unnamed protein product [Effrenium voratum]|uniref:Uncharacterized protein n=1 Tax=Effrenium voratum TaxID=2562239 RepID=A0AA36NCL6_9DINO|nr:unnamed protein product [Effrenium voratum]